MFFQDILKINFHLFLKYPQVKSDKIYFGVTLAVCHPQKRTHIDQQTAERAVQPGVPRANTTPTAGRRPQPRAPHQNDDGNPILPTSGTEARFYKLRDLCQYFTRIRLEYPVCPSYRATLSRLHLAASLASIQNFINLRRNVNSERTHLLIVRRISRQIVK